MGKSIYECSGTHTLLFIKSLGGFFDHRQLMDFWDAEFGMDPREATAILGGHTLGGFEKNNSGYTGDWKEGVRRLIRSKSTSHT